MTQTHGPVKRKNVVVTFNVTEWQANAMNLGAKMLRFPKSDMFRAAVENLIEKLRAKFPDVPEFRREA